MMGSPSHVNDSSSLMGCYEDTLLTSVVEKHAL